jgi:hypothetical protein
VSGRRCSCSYLVPLRGLRRLDAVAGRDDDVEVVASVVSACAVGSSCPDIPDNCVFLKFPVFEHVANAFADWGPSACVDMVCDGVKATVDATSEQLLQGESSCGSQCWCPCAPCTCRCAISSALAARTAKTLQLNVSAWPARGWLPSRCTVGPLILTTLNTTG